MSLLDDCWTMLEARAQRLLEHAKELEPRQDIRHYGSQLRLWHFPAGGKQVTWTLLIPGKKVAPDSPPRVREVTWDHPADHARLYGAEGALEPVNVQPTLHLREAALPQSETQRRLEVGRQLAVPLLVKGNRAGLDGAYFGMETYEISPFVKVQWWGDGPVEWRHFTTWVAELRAFLQNCLDHSG